MNLDDAVTAHVNFKLKLRALIAGSGEVDAKALGADDQCALGKWINGEGVQLATDPNYRVLKELHQKFHAAAGAVAARAKAGQKLEASQLLDGAAYGSASQAVVGAIMQLKRSAKL
jgi:hypothetical protein